MSRLLVLLLLALSAPARAAEPDAELVTTPPAAGTAVAVSPASTAAPKAPGADAAIAAATEAIDPTAATAEPSSAAPELPPNPGLSEGPLTSSAPPTPTQNVTINLINRLVQKGVLTKEDAAELIQQAEADAQMAQAQNAATQDAVAKAQAAAAAAVAATPPAPDDDSVRVTYVPQVVKSQIKDQIKDEVMAQAREEGWADPKLIPPWLPNIRPFADVRVRYEIDTFPDGNDNTGAFPNFNAINTGAPFNVAGSEFSPQLNVDQNRNRMRLRARFGADLNLGQNFTSGIRVATGQDNSPTSTNQSMGLPYNGQGGNFSKYAIWLDRAFIKYEIGGEPTKNLALTVGRFDNPFFTVSNVMWDDDIGFDGIALQAKYEVVRGVTPFLAGGLFPVYNTDFNFSSNQPAKFASYDKWLYAIQGGIDWKITRDWELKGAVGYFYFQNVEGQLSSPYTPLTQNDAGDTDASRPSFAQKGNTYMALRNIVPDASNDYGTTNQWQYFGLATPFHNVDFVARLDYKHFEPFIASIMGEWVQNTAFNAGSVGAKAVNNRGSSDDDLSDGVGSFAGGDTAWTVQGLIGTETLTKRWNWNLSAGYRYVESDAVIDGFTDSDFGGGGTNLKGWQVSGNLAVADNVWLGIRYMSAESISGPPFKTDIVQFDINARF